jgi:hypothetical protein
MPILNDKCSKYNLGSGTLLASQALDATVKPLHKSAAIVP